MKSNENEADTTEIDLYFTIKNSLKSYLYLVNLIMYPDNPEQKIEFKTEQIKSTEDKSLIKFKDIFHCNYYFYKTQELKITVNKIRIIPSFCRNYLIKKEYNPMTLSTIITSKNGKFQIPFEDIPFINYSDKEIIMIEVKPNLNINNNIIFPLPKNTFIDYIISGIKFKNYIAIDFDDPNKHGQTESLNEFLLLIQSFRETLFYFNREFNVFGFDNKLKYDANKKDNINDIFFNLNSEDESLHGYTQIKYAYYDILGKLYYSNEMLKEKKESKNKLSSLINYLCNQIYQKRSTNYYNIIFILINSLNEEQFKDSIDSFFRASFLPISFVIIGIGDDEEQFNTIKKLCEVNKNKKGYRNNIYFKFVEELKCEKSKESNNSVNKIIKNDYLKKIPEQLCEFYKINKISLDEIKSHNKNNENSIKVFETYNSLIIPQLNNKVNQININEKDFQPSLNSIDINTNNQNEISTKEEINTNANNNINNQNNQIYYDNNNTPGNNDTTSSIRSSSKKKEKYKLKGSTLKSSKENIIMPNKEVPIKNPYKK